MAFVGQGSTGTNLYVGPDGKTIDPLENTAGVPFEFQQATGDGQNLTWTFTLNTAPQVTAVVPQPVLTQTNLKLTSLPAAGNILTLTGGAVPATTARISSAVTCN